MEWELSKEELGITDAIKIEKEILAQTKDKSFIHRFAGTLLHTPPLPKPEQEQQKPHV